MPPKKPTKTVVVERVVTTKETRVTYQAKPEPKPKKQSGGACHRCGRTSHWIADCYARTDNDGNDIESDVD